MLTILSTSLTFCHSPGPKLARPRASPEIREWSANCCCCSVAQSCPTLCNLIDCCTRGFPVLHHLPELTQTHVHRVSDAIQPSHLCRPLLFPPSIFPSIRVFSNELVFHIRWPKCWSFSFSISPSNEYSGLISFRMDWLDFLAVQGTLKSLLQHHSSKASSLALSFLYGPALASVYDHWKNHSLDYMSLCQQSDVSAF